VNYYDVRASVDYVLFPQVGSLRANSRTSFWPLALLASCRFRVSSPGRILAGHGGSGALDHSRERCWEPSWEPRWSGSGLPGDQ